MNLGYACLALGVPDTKMRICRINNATLEYLQTLTEQNLNALEAMVRYNAENDIRLYRISSDLVPFGSHPAVSFAWQDIFRERMQHIGQMIRDTHMRVSMHPGQYTVLNSTNAEVVRRAIDDLIYHERVLSSLGMDSTNKIVLHIGGVFGDKKQALARFRTHFACLDDAVKKRLVIENDDRHFHIADVLETGHALGVPVVFDNLHHHINGCDSLPMHEWISACQTTWRERDGVQKIHYSQQDETKREGAHSKTIKVREFAAFYEILPDKGIDVMLEVKDKNLSVVKCALCLKKSGHISELERQWRLYKYLILEKNPSGYAKIRELLKDKSAFPALAFFDIIETSLDADENKGHAANAAQHVWGYFKAVCTQKEKDGFEKLIKDYTAGRIRLERMKKFLLRLSVKYQVGYLLDSYFFLGIS